MFHIFNIEHAASAIMRQKWEATALASHFFPLMSEATQMQPVAYGSVNLCESYREQIMAGVAQPLSAGCAMAHHSLRSWRAPGSLRQFEKHLIPTAPALSRNHPLRWLHLGWPILAAFEVPLTV